MGANHSHPRRASTRRASRTTSATTVTPTTTPSSTPTTSYTPSPSDTAPSDERTSISCEPSRSPIASREGMPLRMGYPYYEEVALEAKRRSRRRSRSLGKVLEGIGLNGSAH
jgi:hypothetical protein